MATVFDEYIQGQYSILHTAVFHLGDVEYELSLQSITKHNTYDSSIAFPKNYSFSAQSCWDFSFDIAENLRKRTYFARAPRGAVNAFSVLRKVESIIFDHYNEFGAGMYIYNPHDKQLAKFYNYLVSKKLGNGFTLESGLDPKGEGYVIRTPNCYK